VAEAALVLGARSSHFTRRRAVRHPPRGAPTAATGTSLRSTRDASSEARVVVALERTCPRPKPRAQYAFKDSMIHGVLQFALRIAFRCALHRSGSQDIHRRELSLQLVRKKWGWVVSLHATGGLDGSAAARRRRGRVAAYAAWHGACREFWAPRLPTRGASPVATGLKGVRVRASRRTESARVCALRVNDPSAGSPTER
jgi:hypothetical protein